MKAKCSKRIILLPAVMLMLTVFITAVGAAGDAYKSVYGDTGTDEYSAVVSAVKGNSSLPDNVSLMSDSQFESNTCKLYRFDKIDMAAYYETNGSLKGIFKDTGLWAVYTPNGNTVKVENKNGVCAVLGYSMAPGGVSDKSVISKSGVVKALENDTRSILPDELKFVEAEQYNSNFVYIRSGNDEYLIPYSSRPEICGLENGRLYKAVEVVKAYKENYSFNTGDGNADGGMGAVIGNAQAQEPDNNSSFNIWLVLIPVIVILTGGIAAVTVFKVKAKPRNS